MLLNRSKELFKQLRPASEFHKRRNIEALKGLTKEFSELIAHLPSKGAELNVDIHLQRATQGILQEKAVNPRSPLKPTLNTSDLDVDPF